MKIEKDFKYDEMTITAADVIFTGSCNMQCSYCFIHKNPQKMKEYNAKVRAALADGSYAQKVSEVLADAKYTLETFALWGGEPTLNADLFEGFIFDILDFFPNIKDIHFSTNGTNSVLPFVEAAEKYIQTKNPDRALNVDIQFSIDGPPHITDKSRALGATAGTFKRVKELAEWGNIHCYDKLRVATFPKATLDEDEFCKLADDDNLFQWFKFFDEWQDELNQLCPNAYCVHKWCAEPAFAQPSHWTSKHAPKYLEFVNKMMALDEKDFKHYHHPFCRRTFSQYLMFAFREPGATYPVGSIGCNAGLRHFTVDYSGLLISCHHVYDNFNLGLGESKYEHMLGVTTARDQLEKSKMNYLHYLYHDSVSFRRAHIYSLVLLLIKTGEIDAKYAEPYWFDRLFLFMSYEAHCFTAEAMDETHSIFLTDLGSVRIYCHGALERLVEYYEEHKGVYTARRSLFGV